MVLRTETRFLTRLTKADTVVNLRKTNLVAALFHLALLAFIVAQIFAKYAETKTEQYVCTDNAADNKLSCTCEATPGGFLESFNIQLLRLTTSLPSFMRQRLKESITTDAVLYPCPNENAVAECTFWGEISTENVSPINLVALIVTFTVVTIVAHFVYFGCYTQYLSMIQRGYNAWRWIEYGISASIMAVILAVISGVRLQTSVVMIFVATLVQMLQGYLIEHAIATQSVRSPQCYVPLFVGWLLLVVVWVTIWEAWFSGLNRATKELKECKAGVCNVIKTEENEREKKGEASPSESLKYLIIAVIVLFSGFGIVNLAYYVHAYTKGPLVAQKHFPLYEFSYICLSFISKALLILWVFFSIFKGELIWLQTGGLSSKDENKPEAQHKFTSYSSNCKISGASA